MLQQLTIIGRLGKDADKGNTNNQPFVRLNVAVDTGYFDKANNQWVERTSWWNCTLWKDISVDRYKKGAIVMVQGTPLPSIYTGQDGVTRIDLKMKAEIFRILVKSPSDNSTAAETSQDTAYTNPQVSGNGDVF